MKKFGIAVLIALLLSPNLFSQQYDDLQEKQIDNERIKLFPTEGKNYFFLQSIDNKTQIVIGDLSSVEKKIILIYLQDDFTTIRSVVEYIPAKRSLKVGKGSTSQFFTSDIAKLKRDIISGAIYQGKNADSMKSFDDLEKVFKQNDASRIFADVYGFNVKLAEVDEINKIMAMYTFGNHIVLGYYMQFKTFYYRENPKTERKPKLKYSVFSKNTQDPIIKEYVEKLFQIRRPASSFAK